MEKSAKKLIAKPVYSISEGLLLGYVKNIVIDNKEKCVLALITERRRMTREEKIIPFAHLQSIGEDAVTINKAAHAEVKPNLPQIVRQMNNPLQVVGARVFSVGGKIIGKVIDFYFEEDTGKISALEIGEGNLLKEKVLLPGKYIITIAGGTIMVDDLALNDLVGSENSLKEGFDKAISGISQNISAAFNKRKEEPTVIMEEQTPTPEEPTDIESEIQAETQTETQTPPPTATETPELPVQEKENLCPKPEQEN